jgi:hypothetical protein
MVKKNNIPRAIKQQVWLKHIGKKFEDKCTIKWCQNVISVFNFHTGHNIPESKGGTINIDNLRPICSNCNLSMNDTYSIDEWNILCVRKDINNNNGLFSVNFFNYLYKLVFYQN